MGGRARRGGHTAGAAPAPRATLLRAQQLRGGLHTRREAFPPGDGRHPAIATCVWGVRDPEARGKGSSGK